MSVVLRGEKFYRRTALTGLSALGVSLLASSVDRSVRAAAGEGNIIFFFSPNGCLREDFGADGSTTDFTLRRSLQPLEALQDRISVIHNINNLGYPARQVSHDNITRVMTCVNGTDPKVAAGPSIDHVLAGAVGESPLVLGVHPVSRSVSWHNRLSWARAGVPTTPELDSSAVFQRVFPMNPGMTGPDPDAARHNARERSILDAVRGDMRTLSGRLGPTGRDLLDIHTTSLRELETTLIRNEVGEMLCDVSGVETSLASPLPFPPGSPDRKSAAYAELLEAHGRLQMDIIATAIACGQRRVGTLVWQPCAMEGVNVMGTIPSIGHHDVSHWAASDPPQGLSTDAAKAEYQAIDLFYAEQYRYLLDKLMSLGLLADTFVPWVTDTRDAAHQQGRFHMVVGGGESHGVRTGRFVEYDYSGGNDPKQELSNRSFADLWVSAHHIMGVTPPMSDGKEHFGPAQYCQGRGLEEIVSPAA